jgi:hypothetical protein
MGYDTIALIEFFCWTQCLQSGAGMVGRSHPKCQGRCEYSGLCLLKY